MDYVIKRKEEEDKNGGSAIEINIVDHYIEKNEIGEFVAYEFHIKENENKTFKILFEKEKKGDGIEIELNEWTALDFSQKETAQLEKILLKHMKTKSKFRIKALTEHWTFNSLYNNEDRFGIEEFIDAMDKLDS